MAEVQKLLTLEQFSRTMQLEFIFAKILLGVAVCFQVILMNLYENGFEFI